MLTPFASIQGKVHPPALSLREVYWIADFCRGPRICCGNSIGAQFDLGVREAAVKIAPPDDRPPRVEKNLDGPPVGDPGDDYQAFFQEAPKWSVAQDAGYDL